MQKNIYKLVCCLLAGGGFLSAGICSYEVDFQTGYRQDRLSWDIGVPGGTPDILSELEWKNLQSLNFEGKLKMLADDGFYARLGADYGITLSGTNQDSDYHGNNRTEEYSRSIADAKGGHVYDVSGAFGRQFVLKEHLKLMPLVGYSFHEQYLKMKNGTLLIYTHDPEMIGYIYGLNSSYTSRWHGPYLGFDMNFEATCNLQLLATFEYHFAFFKGLGHWNLREDFFKDFEHTAKGGGIVLSFGALYQINQRLSIGAVVNYESFKATKGRDRTFLLVEQDNQLIPIVYDSHFNRVRWMAISALLSLNYSF